MNYLIVINKSNLIDDSYYENLELIECKDILGEIIKVEKMTYKKHLELKDYLETKNIFVGLNSAYRSIENQQEILDEYTLKYGIDYVNKYVAPVKTSEHHTGLALDLALIVDDKECTESEELFGKEKIYLEIHKYLSEFGFILRYPKGKEVADIIYKNNLTLEEYVLGE